MEAGLIVRFEFDGGLVLIFRTPTDRERAKLAFATLDDEAQLTDLCREALQPYTIVRPALDRVFSAANAGEMTEAMGGILRAESAGGELTDYSLKMLAVQCRVISHQLRATLVGVEGWQGEGGPSTVERFIEKAAWNVFADAARAVGEILSGEFEKRAVMAA